MILSAFQLSYQTSEVLIVFNDISNVLDDERNTKPNSIERN